ncbi:MAG TPA: hypothetical protein VHB47_26910 [Thermoanaerobaculia bacterium]|jgi:hypothetical protein|nr:hypothetical protein [Thermoanaerobaculia bacterium]
MSTAVVFDQKLARILRGMAATFGLSFGEFLENMAIRALCGQDPITEDERRLIKELCTLHGVSLEKMARERHLGRCLTSESASTVQP